MSYNFDKVVRRENTNCVKWDLRGETFGKADIIPLWVADMDFETPDFILEAIRERLQHPVLAYSFRSNNYREAIVEWIKRRNGWNIQPEWIEFTPGVVPGLAFSILAYTEKNDNIVIQPPVYHPFRETITSNERTVVNNPLQVSNEKFVIDFDDLDKKLQTAKAIIISNPHNPVARAYTKDELSELGKLCLKHGITIISDEIHSDLIQAPHCHTHIASLSNELAQQTITFISPSKTFNTAGLSTGVAIIPNKLKRMQYKHWIDCLHVGQGNIFGTVALEAAFRNGDDWMREVNEYIGRNIDYVINFIHQYIPNVKCYRPEATYLMWIDFTAWNMDHESLYRFLIDKAGLGLNSGTIFGEEGKGHMRINLACPKSTLEKAMTQLKEACSKRK